MNDFAIEHQTLMSWITYEGRRVAILRDDLGATFTHDVVEALEALPEPDERDVEIGELHDEVDRLRAEVNELRRDCDDG